MSHKVRLIAIYLPQFHPVPENDEWHGKGFTEWTNVTKARSLFKGHYQPLLPSDLGFYDLRLAKVRGEQANLARDHGVEGFCYWHYWFGGGKRILEMPFNEVLASGEPDFPFCLGWANASWTGIWYGMKDSVILEQKYLGEDDDRKHFYEMLPAFKDSRYMKVDGRPIFLIYNPSEHPYLNSFMTYWNQLAHDEGMQGMYFIAAMRGDQKLGEFDAVTFIDPFEFFSLGRLRSLVQGIAHKYFGRPRRIIRYKQLLDFLVKRKLQPNEIPLVVPNFDNTARSGKMGVVILDPNPDLFEQMLENAVAKVLNKPKQERIVILEAWNEWAEGNYVEPDRRFGDRFLKAIKNVMYSEKINPGVKNG